MLEEAPYIGVAELLDDARVCTIPQAEVMTLIHHHQGVASQFSRMLAGEVATCRNGC